MVRFVWFALHLIDVENRGNRQMKTNRQQNNAKARKDKARQEQRLQATVEYLQENKAWNWRWPGPSDHTRLPRNCWFTGLAPRNPNPRHNGNELQGTHPYFGPSKRTLKRRQARRGLRSAETSALARTIVGT